MTIFPLLLQLAHEFGHKFFETSAKDNIGVQEVKTNYSC